MNTPSSSSTTGNWMDVGHYTQVVWYDTQQCGCGKGNSPVVGPIYVCQYSPPGNYQGVYPYPAITWSSPGGSTLSSIAMDTHPSTGDWFAVVRGTDNHLYFNKYAQTTKSWGGWTPIGGTTNDEPAIVFTSSYFHVVIRGADNVLYHRKLNAGTNTWDAGWTRVGGHTFSAPVVVRKNWGSYANDEILLVVRGTDNQVYTNQFTGTSWAAWMSWGGDNV